MHVYIALAPIQDYVNQESVWSLNSSTYQRKYLATSEVFAGSMCMSIYISTDFQISERLPEFSHNYTIDCLIEQAHSQTLKKGGANNYYAEAIDRAAGRPFPML